MSFTQYVKNEITLNDLSDNEAKAQLAALIMGNASIVISNKNLQLQATFSQALIAKRFVQLVKQIYQVQTKLTTFKRVNLKKDNIYEIVVHEKTKIILEDLGLWTNQGLHDLLSVRLVASDQTISAYIAGWFLASGSVNSPRSSNYHLEFRVNKNVHRDHLIELLSRYTINAKVTSRRNQTIVYIKASDQIADVLRLMKAHQSLMEYENIRIQRDFHNSLTRLDNCELANEVKSLNAGSKQVSAINTLEKHHRLQFLDERLIDIANLRVSNPEASLKELAQIYEKESGIVMSKSGIKHRLDKLIQIANKIEEKENLNEQQ